MTAAADRRERTDRRLRLRRTAKLYALPAIGLLAMLLVGELFRIDMRDVAAAIWGGLSALLVKLGVDIGQYSASRWIANGLFGLVAGSVATGLLNRLGVIDRLFPDPPTFVFADLEAERTRTLLEIELGTPPPLTGREAELARLEALLDRPGKDRFAVVQATGPTGIGKTRLSVEWLARAEAAGWDIGVIDPERLDRVRGWKARRPTALVLDEADSARFRQHSAGTSPIEALLVDLLRGASKAHPVRLVLAGQTAVWGAGQAPENLRPYLAPGDLVLAPLDQDAMAVLAGKLASEQGSDAELIQRESAGRPRHAIVLARAPEGTGTYHDALNEWANRAVPALTNEQDEVEPAFAVGLIAAALVGPVPTAALAAALPEFAVGPLLRFFPGETRRGLETELPRLEPADWAQVLALRLLDRLPPRLSEDVALPLLLEHPEALEASLGEIWRDYPHWVPTHRDYPAQGSWQADLAARLMALQTAFDTRWPERVAGIRHSIWQAVDDCSASATFLEAQKAVKSAIAIADSRPFDHAIRKNEARVAVNAIHHFKMIGVDEIAFAFDEVERWSGRIDDLLKIIALKDDLDVRRQEANAVVNAMNYYGMWGAHGEGRAFELLETWGERLDALIQCRLKISDIAIRRSEAQAALNAVIYYGSFANKSKMKTADDGIQRWCNRLLSMLDQQALTFDREIRLSVASGVADAIHSYCMTDNLADRHIFTALAKWADCLKIISAAESRSETAIIHKEAASLVNLVEFYGKMAATGDSAYFQQVEQCGQRFDELISDLDLSDNPKIRLCEAQAIVNATNYYGRAGAFDLINQWASRFDRIFLVESLQDDLAIRLAEAKCSFNVIHYLGLAGTTGHAESFAETEAWFDRFDRLFSVPQFSVDPTLRLEQAKSLANSIAFCGRAGIAGDSEAFQRLELLGSRFSKILSDPRLGCDAELRLEEAKAIGHAIYAYANVCVTGQADALKYIAHWESRLDALVGDARFAGNPAIRLLEAKAASYAIYYFGRVGTDADWLRWRRRLARLIQLFAYRPEFSALAIEYNLTISDQESRGWPHGRYRWGEHGRELMTQPPHG